MFDILLGQSFSEHCYMFTIFSTTFKWTRLWLNLLRLRKSWTNTAEHCDSSGYLLLLTAHCFCKLNARQYRYQIERQCCL